MFLFVAVQALMPQIEDAFTATLGAAQLTWLPQPLPAAVPHPQADKLETCCRCGVKDDLISVSIIDLNR
jgi:hypothetical protein